MFINISGKDGLSNAVKFPSVGRVRLSCNIISVDENFARVELVVTDTGIGIPEEMQSKVFGQFEQADSSTIRCYGGSGLGLSITKKFVDLHGGNTSLQSKPGKDSTVKISLELENAFDRTTTIKDYKIPDLSAYHILIFADNDVNSEVILKFLALTMCRVSLAFDGEEALRCMEAVPYDLVLLDIHMPKKSGIEVLKELKERNSLLCTPVVAVSARINQKNKENCKETGMVVFKKNRLMWMSFIPV